MIRAGIRHRPACLEMCQCYALAARYATSHREIPGACRTLVPLCAGDRHAALWLGYVIGRRAAGIGVRLVHSAGPGTAG